MKSLLILFLSLFSFSGACRAQQLSIPGKTDQIYIDQLQNLYTVSGDNIRKYLPDGSLQYEISPKRFGLLTAAEFNDPLRPLLFYRDQGLLQILDNTLSEQGRAIDLFSVFPNQVWLVSQSADNHLWFFTTDNFELIRTDRSLQEVARSGNLLQVLGKVVMPTWMIERNSKLYLADPELGVMVFDIYGTYIKTLPVKGLQRFQIHKEQLVFLQKDQLCIYDPLSFETSCTPLEEDARTVLLGKDKIYLQLENEVRILLR